MNKRGQAVSISRLLGVPSGRLCRGGPHQPSSLRISTTLVDAMDYTTETCAPQSLCPTSEAHTPQLESSPLSLQPEKTHNSKEDPVQPKRNKEPFKEGALVSWVRCC